MTAVTPVERVAELLVQTGYKRIDSPIAIAGLHFDFPAAFIGTGKSPDLIIVSDGASEDDTRFQHKVEGLARTLDLMQSRRPLTIIVTGPRPRGTIFDALSRVGRVLTAGDAGQAKDLRDALAILLPLDLPAAREITSASVTLHRSRNKTEPLRDALLTAAQNGEDAVRECIHRSIAEPFDELTKTTES